jgi:hypothetical protein
MSWLYDGQPAPFAALQPLTPAVQPAVATVRKR